jgi:hypothetical protein
MIKVQDCSGPVMITDLELDGNVAGTVVGGPWGDTGWQLAMTGLGLYDNSGPEVVRNVYTHHHGQDGLTIDGVDRDRGVRSQIVGVRSEHNGRQGCSLVGGRGYDFVDCHFNHTGGPKVASAPGAGIDIEAENKRIRDLTFRRCEFSDNHGPGLLADQGDSESAVFTGCTFVGATSWAAWPRMPGFSFHRCNFVGPISNCFGDERRPARATTFTDCTFRDDPALSPSRRIYVQPHTSGPIADLPDHPNVLFAHCVFALTHANTLPWTTNKVIFSGCTLTQKSPATSYPRGTFVGYNTISAPVDLYGCIVKGKLVVNGRSVQRT